MPDPLIDHPRLLPPRFLFRFQIPLGRCDATWSEQMGIALEERHRLLNLAALDGERHWADVRLAWSPPGMLVQLSVTGKRQPPWCRDTRLEDSDGLQLWLDTRPAKHVHRATKFCHRFVFLPSGGGQRLDQPLADQLLIPRARENARPVRPRELKVHAKPKKDGYQLAALIPAVVLDGFDPNEQIKLGFNYAVFDREYGMQTLSAGGGFPFQEDPSLWAMLEMVP